MDRECRNVLRVSSVTPDWINVELPEDPLSNPRPPPTVTPAGIPGPSSDPPLRVEELVGLEPRRATRVTLGRPQVVRLTAAPAGDTTGLADFVGRDPAGHFFLIHLACSFDPCPAIGSSRRRSKSR
jgi:hypothetical protein